MASRVLWKGAISFGLVHIPVALHTATTDNSLDFDWLDKRTMDPVGYKRINKNTGEEIAKEDIIKGIAYEGADYVVLTDEEIAAAYPRSTQTIEIESFVGNGDIPFVYLERPYYIAPIDKGHKVFALLRDTLVKTQRVGIARVVIQTKQHLAALVPSGAGLVLNLLRWGADVRYMEDLDLPPDGAQAAGITARELKMARQLVDDMTDTWQPERYTDSFREKILALVAEKVRLGQTQTVTQPDARDEEAAPAGAQIVDLTALLQRSLRQPRSPTDDPATPPNSANSSSGGKGQRKTPAGGQASRATHRPAVHKTTSRKGAAGASAKSAVGKAEQSADASKPDEPAKARKTPASTHRAS